MGLFKSIKKAITDVGGGIHKAIKGTIKRVRRAADFVSKKIKGFASKIGPLGTIALMAAAIYFTGPAGAGWWGTGAAEAGMASSVSAVGAGTTEAVATGTMGISEGLTAVASTSATAGSEALFTSAALGESAASAAYGTAAYGEAALAGGSSGLYTSAALAESGAAATGAGLGALGADLAPSVYSGAGSFEAGAELSFLDTTGEAALGGAGTPVGGGFDLLGAAKQGLSLLSGGAGAGQGSMLQPVAPPSLQQSEAVRSLSAGTGGGLGFSKFTEEAQSGLTGAARQAEQYYKSLLARGVR